MGYQAVNAVLSQSKATGSDRLVLLVLAAHADETTFECHPGRDLLCKEAAMAERNLQYCLKRLEDSGELAISRGVGRGNLTTYKIALDTKEKAQGLAPFPTQKKVQSDAEKMQNPAPFETEKGCNPAPEKVQCTVEKVQPTVIKGAKQPGAYKDIESSGNNQESSGNHSARARETAASVWQSVFGEPLAIFSAERVAEADIADLAVWRSTLEMWWTNQYSRRNLTRIIEVYREKLAEKRNGVANGINHAGHRTAPIRETHNARAARQTLELLKGIGQQGRGDHYPDPDDGAAPGITVDLSRRGA